MKVSLSNRIEIWWRSMKIDVMKNEEWSRLVSVLGKQNDEAVRSVQSFIIKADNLSWMLDGFSLISVKVGKKSTEIPKKRRIFLLQDYHNDPP
jgi:hypothetical protein